MDIMNEKPMTVKEVIKRNNQILQSIMLSPNQREEYGKICSVIDNNNACIEAMERSEAEAENTDGEEIPEVTEDAVSETE